MRNDTCSQLLKEREVAEYLGVSVKSLRRWRFDRRGPNYVKVAGKLVRYPFLELQAWIGQQTITNS